MARNHGMDFCAPASGDRFTACPIDPGMEMVMPHTRASPLTSSPKGNLKGKATGVHKLPLCASAATTVQGVSSVSRCGFLCLSAPVPLLPSLSLSLQSWGLNLGIKPSCVLGKLPTTESSPQPQPHNLLNMITSWSSFPL